MPDDSLGEPIQDLTIAFDETFQRGEEVFVCPHTVVFGGERVDGKWGSAPVFVLGVVVDFGGSAGGVRDVERVATSRATEQSCR